MKIEKINDNQIRCILDKSDLLSRNIKASELAYGSDKANILFKEMTEQANRQFGFQISDTPVMIEAIPLADESIVLIITKVDDPEELDTRFSRFSPGKDEPSQDVQNNNKINKANEILNLLNTFREALSDSSGLSVSPLSALKKGSTGNIIKNGSEPDNLIIIFQFDNIDKIIELSKVLSIKYHGLNSLYKKNSLYYLTVAKSDHTPEEFNQICNIICEYGNRTSNTGLSREYIEEHCEIILNNNALQELSKIL